MERHRQSVTVPSAVPHLLAPRGWDLLHLSLAEGQGLLHLWQARGRGLHHLLVAEGRGLHHLWQAKGWGLPHPWMERRVLLHPLLVLPNIVEKHEVSEQLQRGYVCVHVCVCVCFMWECVWIMWENVCVHHARVCVCMHHIYVCDCIMCMHICVFVNRQIMKTFDALNVKSLFSWLETDHKFLQTLTCLSQGQYPVLHNINRELLRLRFT